MNTNDCLFCKIAKGEIPSKKVYEDRDVIAFLDINPATPGHTLVVPKKHAEDMTTADEKDLEKTIAVVKKIVARQKERLGAQGVNVMQNNGHAAGQLVAHLHFHVIPRFANDNVIIKFSRTNINENEMEEIRKKLSEEHAPAPARKEFDLDF
jgi:histidine triad (HIT) family protein